MFGEDMSVRVEKVGLESPMKGNRTVAQALPAYCSLGFNTINDNT